jgi:hypothetical protein
MDDLDIEAYLERQVDVELGRENKDKAAAGPPSK